MIDNVFTSVLCVFVVVYYICFRVCKLCENKKTCPPGPFGLPVVGHLPFLDKYPERTFSEWRKKYGNIFQIRMGHWNTIVLNGFDVVQAAADFDNDVFSDRFNFATFKLFVKVNRGIHSLATCPFNDTYLQSRKTTATALRVMTRNANPVFTEIVSTSAQSFCSNLIAKGITGPVSVDHDIHRAIGTILYKAIYGRGQDATHVNEKVDLFLNMTKELFQVASSGNPVDVIPWLKYFMPSALDRYKKALELYRNFDDAELQAHKETYDPDSIKDVADLVIEYETKQKGMKDTETDPVCLVLYNNLKDMFEAGIGTSSSTLQWLTLYMIAYPEIQSKVQQEIDDIVGQDRSVELDDRKNLHYTMAVILECWRLVSSVPFALPHRALRDTRFMGYDVAEGTHIMFNVHSIHHENEFWGDPDNFRPERLLDGSGRLDKQQCIRIVPFGLGRRRCVGEALARAEIFVLFASLMQCCKLAKPEDEILDLTPVPGLIYFPKPFSITVKDRRLMI